MSEKKQKFRSEQSRRNYEQAEKRRLRAAKRKELQAKKNELAAQAKTWVSNNRAKTVLITAAAVVVVLAIWLACKWFVGPDGSLPNFFGNVRGVEDTWVVTDLNPYTNANANSSNIDTAKKSNTPRYYHLATLAPIDGYTADPGFTFSQDGNNQDQHYTAVDENADVTSVYLFGIPNKTAEKHVGDMISVMSISNVVGETMTANVGGYDATYTYFVYDQPTEDGSEPTEAYASLNLCINTPYDACLMLVLNTRDMLKTELLTADELMVEAEKVLANVTVCD